VLVGLVVLVGLAAPAGAHAILQQSEPAAGSVLASPPERISLHFSEPVELQLGSVKLFDGKGRQLDAAPPERSDGNRTVSIAAPGLGNGIYVVSWRVVSADSHPVSAAFVFTVGPASAAPVDATSVIAAVQSSSDHTVGVVFGIVRALAYAALAVLIGGGLFVTGVWPGAARSRAVRRLLGGSWALALVTSLAGVGLQGAYAAGGSLGDVFHPSIWSDIARTHFGEAWLARAVILCVLALPLLIALLRRTARIGPNLALGWGVVLAALVVTVVLAGHAATGRWIWVGIAADVVHVMAMCFWLGGLTVLLVLLAAMPPGLLVDVVSRFSRLAFGAVGLIVVSGIVQSWRQLGSFGALTSSTYGRLLLAKVGLVVVVVALAALSRRLLGGARSSGPRVSGAVPGGVVGSGTVGSGTVGGETVGSEPVGPRGRGPLSLSAAAGDAQPDGPARAPRDADAGLRRALRRSVLGEVLTAAAVLAVTAVLVNAAPPRETAPSGPFDVQLTLGTLQADVVVDPPKVGPSEMHVYASTAQGAPAKVDEVTARLTQPPSVTESIDVAFTRITGNHFVSNALVFPFKGRWSVQIQARTGDFDVQDATFTVPVG
jgi:copper transport protein